MSTLRPADLAREHGISTQAVRNYERDGFIPPAQRTPTGYRVYTELHATALRTYLALIPAYGHETSGRIMNALHNHKLDDALTLIDRGHLQLLRDRDTLDAVRKAVNHLTTEAEPTTAPTPSSASATTRSIGELAHQLRVTPATLRNWEAAHILTPARDPATGNRLFDAADIRDAQLTHLLRRGGYPLNHISTVIQQLRTAGDSDKLSNSLKDWQQALTTRGLAMLTAATHLSHYLESPQTRAPASNPR